MISQELAQGIDQLGLTVDLAKQQKLLDYLALLHKWNRVYNLTAVRQKEQMVISHLLDCLAVDQYLWPQRWLDVGCGAGLPGVVLAIVRPEWTWTLLDSNSKKTSFVQQTSIELGLNNIEIHCGRVEEFDTNNKYDGIISRAFSDAADFVSTTRHLLKEGGRWVAMKGSPEQELLRLPVDIKVEKKIALEIPKLGAARCLVVMKEDK
jgi:16S rRNA (guanine527-N7)-methyltransferase